MEQEKYDPVADQLIESLKRELNAKLQKLEEIFEADVIFFYGQIQNGMDYGYRAFIEHLRQDEKKNNKLVILINTPGGSVETVEKFVNINKHFYEEVYFVVPDIAMSAGTVFCLSGDKIFMDYYSSLGPIDPQVFNGKQFVPALGYLDKVNEFVVKSQNNSLSQAELMLLQQNDLAFLRLCEQHRDLTITLIKEWLVKYKFKNWTVHSSNGATVTENEKITRAQQIAQKLGDNTVWHSHGRCIDIRKLNEMGLKIDDYSDNKEMKEAIRTYNNLVLSYIWKMNLPTFFHSRNYV